VIDQYPSSTKVPDALLKRGFSEDEMGDSQRAIATLNSVIEQYPDTSAARLAKVRLDRIKQQSR
jgi:TolA-binding protein